MSSTLSADPDEVSIIVGQNKFAGWQSVQITRSCEVMPNSFALTASVEALEGQALTGTQPGQACQIFIGADQVINGWIDRRSIEIDAHNHQFTLSGRGITRNLVDCSVDLANSPAVKNGYITATNALSFAQALSDAYGITCISPVSDLGKPILGVQVRPSETPYQIIKSVAQFSQFLLYEDEFGRLVLDRVGTNQMASGFVLGANIEAISADRSVDERFSEYVVIWQDIAQLNQLDGSINFAASSVDPYMTEHRVKIMVSPQYTPDFDIGKAFADWNFNRRYGRSQAAHVTCDAWRDNPGNGQTGKLWRPNWLANLHAPAADIFQANWIIATATFRKDLSGTHADLVLMPPEAFSPQPNPLNLFNRQLNQNAQSSQDPPPGISGGL